MGSVTEHVTRNNHNRPARDTHAMSPDNIQESYWTYNRAKASSIDTDLSIVDFTRGLTSSQKEKVRPIKTIPSTTIEEACQAFQTAANKPITIENPAECIVYEHADLPGLHIYTQLLPPEAQYLLLSQIMHRDLANPHHKTNINADYDTTYPSTPSTHPDTTPSFFTRPGSSSNPSEQFVPKDEKSTLKSLNTTQVLQKKLRWLTLGDQYDWPTRSYSGTDTTSFPSDISKLVSGLFPALNAQSGVVLLYSAKDFMPVHRDVSEQCERGLASFTLGCDGLFTIVRDTQEGVENNNEPIVLRVRSGDVLELSGEARWAWHAMPKILPGTCPDFLKDWPAGSEELMGYGKDSKIFEKWRGYMSGKRLNLSCREVWTP